MSMNFIDNNVVSQCEKLGYAWTLLSGLSSCTECHDKHPEEREETEELEEEAC